MTVRDAGGAIRRLAMGAAEVEQRAGEMVADVLWIDGDQRVAFEARQHLTSGHDLRRSWPLTARKIWRGSISLSGRPSVARFRNRGAECGRSSAGAPWNIRIYQACERLLARTDGRFPETNGTCHGVRLDVRPKIEKGFRFPGWLVLSDGQQEIVDDVAVLGGWRDVGGACVPDIGQYNQSYAGAITGLHDGGWAGGTYHVEVAQRVEDAWREAEAILSSGYAYPSSRGVVVDVR